MKYTKTTSKTVCEYAKNKSDLIKEFESNGFELIDARPCNKFAIKDLYWYKFEKNQEIDTDDPNKQDEECFED
jgi:hypothetical protein